ncbi:MAG: adenosylcobinamide-phosphate synthase CbiB [Thermodesulfobacteriota bacterium]
MIALEVQIGLAIALDQLLGDPRWLPHPVRLIGAACLALERVCRKLLPARLAGICTVALVLALTATAVQGLLAGAALLHPWLAEATEIVLLYTTIAARDLVRHSRDVHRALAQNDLPEARQRVGMIVGRDTAGLDAAGVSRAAVESVAESMVDGVTAPLFFAVLAGPLGAMLYKAVNTMDSMFGYKNDRYREFGWAAARLDDVANFLPARLTGLMVPAAALLLGLEARNSLRILRRDRLNHASPNSGHTEAAMAGALGIQLGGPSSYFGAILAKPTLGDPDRAVAPGDIFRANRLMLLGAALTLLLLLVLKKLASLP